MYHLDEVRPQYKNGGNKKKVKANHSNLYNAVPNTYREALEDQYILNFRHSVEDPNNTSLRKDGNYYPDYRNNEPFETIGDGFVVKDNPYVEEMFKVNNARYLTPEQHNELKKRRLAEDKATLRKVYKDLGVNYDELPFSTRFLATDIQYNPGIKKFNEFKKASIKGDKAKIKKESHRVRDGVSLNRNKDTDAIYDLINEHYW